MTFKKQLRERGPPGNSCESVRIRAVSCEFVRDRANPCGFVRIRAGSCGFVRFRVKPQAFVQPGVRFGARPGDQASSSGGPTTISVLFCPPKPKLLDMQVRTSALRGALGT